MCFIKGLKSTDLFSKPAYPYGWYIYRPLYNMMHHALFNDLVLESGYECILDSTKITYW